MVQSHFAKLLAKETLHGCLNPWCPPRVPYPGMTSGGPLGLGQASELSALRHEVEILRGRTHLVPTSGKTGRLPRASSTGSLGGLGSGSSGVHEQRASTTLLLKPKGSSVGKNLGSLDSLVDPVSQGLQLDKVRKTKDDTIVVSLPTESAAHTLRTSESLTSIYDIEESSTLMPQFHLGNVDSSLDKVRVLTALRMQRMKRRQTCDYVAEQAQRGGWSAHGSWLRIPRCGDSS